jgi:hypothetical protein
MSATSVSRIVRRTHAKQFQLTLKWAIVVHPSFFYHVSSYGKANQNGVSFGSRPQTPSSDAAYQCKYLFGNGVTDGVVGHCLSNGISCDIWLEADFKNQFNETAPHYDLIDFQWASNIPFVFIDRLMAMKKMISGWAPPEMGDKSFQALLLASGKGTGVFPVSQVLFYDINQLPTIQQSEINRHFSTDCLIAKPFSTAHSHQLGKYGYYVAKRNRWEDFLKFAQEQCAWFKGHKSLIVQEFHNTQGQTLIHKTFFATGFFERTLSPNFSLCFTIPGSISNEGNTGPVVPFAEVYRMHSWVWEDVPYRKNFLRPLSSILPPFPCLYGVDLVAAESGALYILELNKIAGTYLGSGSSSSTSPLSQYLNALTAISSDYDYTIAYDRYRAFYRALCAQVIQMRRTWINGNK